MKSRTGLGRGLDALINPELTDFNKETVEGIPLPAKGSDIFEKIPVSAIVPNPFQPRKEFTPESLSDLMKSISENGLIQPITVRKVGVEKYEIVSGERRWRAVKELRHTEIPAYILEVASDELMLAMALIENLQREDLNAIEVANAYQRLMQECSLTQDEIARRVGKDRSTVTNSLRLLKLPAEVQDCIIRKEISMGHARALAGLTDSVQQILLLKKILAQGLSVRQVESLTGKIKPRMENKPKQGKTQVAERQQSAVIQDIQGKLMTKYGSKVTIRALKDGRGEVAIEYYSEDDFERIIELLYH
jgi:ParB family chromosome partitioning protein